MSEILIDNLRDSDTSQTKRRVNALICLKSYYPPNRFREIVSPLSPAWAIIIRWCKKDTSRLTAEMKHIGNRLQRYDFFFIGDCFP